MISISDFRRNNYIETDHGFAKVVEVYEERNTVLCMKRNGKRFETEKFAPVFLTTDLLMSIKEMTKQGENCYLHPKLIGYIKYNYTLRCFEWINSDGCPIRTIEFVNILQNIYYSLNSEELFDAEKLK